VHEILQSQNKSCYQQSYRQKTFTKVIKVLTVHCCWNATVVRTYKRVQNLYEIDEEKKGITLR